MKIGIACVCGIGSNLALNLVRTKIKCLKNVDSDRVEESNLNRQFYVKDQISIIACKMCEVVLDIINRNF